MKKPLLISAFVVMLVVGVTGVVQALPQGGTGYDDYYYSDATFTEVVGEYYMECDGSPQHWGVRTAYVQADSWDCATGGSIGSSCPSGFYFCAGPNDPNDFGNCSCV
jgi:hypothetical protein